MTYRMKDLLGEIGVAATITIFGAAYGWSFAFVAFAYLTH